MVKNKILHLQLFSQSAGVLHRRMVLFTRIPDIGILRQAKCFMEKPVTILGIFI